MKFPQHCAEASRILRELSDKAGQMESRLLELEEEWSEESLTLLVQDVLGAKSLSEEILQHHLPALEVEEEAPVAEAIKIAHEELQRRVWGVRHDLDVLTARRTAQKSRIKLRRVS